MEIERNSSAVLTARFPDVAQGWEHWVLLRSDAHHDSPSCDRALEEQHLKMMTERDGSWADFGDLFDAMQGKFDPRRSYDEIRPEDRCQKYYDSIGDHAAEFYEPYADRCLMLGTGNHETATLKNGNTDLTDRLVKALNAQLKERGNGHEIRMGGYGGWVRFLFTINRTKGRSILLKYMHGAGGTAPVTKGVIQTNRQAVFLPDANVVINGHNHQGYTLPLARERVSRGGKQFKDIQWHGRIPGYKDDYGDGSGGFAVEKGHSPNPLGALWLHFEYVRDGVKYKLETEIQ